MSSCTLYNRETIDQLPWPETADGDYVRNFLTPLIKEGARSFIQNVDTEMWAAQVDNIVMPVSVNHSLKNRCYVCSPTSLYSDYGKQEFSSPFLDPFFTLMRKMLEWGQIDKMVIVNNWLFSTNLFPKMTQEQIQSVVESLRNRFPQHAVAVRSVTPLQDPSLYSSLKNLGFTFLASRPVFITDTSSDEAFRSRMFKSDLKILKKSPYEVLEHDQIPLTEAKRLIELYRMLNVDKYSELNPQFTERFGELSLQQKTLTFKALQKEGRIDGVFGYFEREGVITSPFFGYDTSVDPSLGLYRQISTLLALEARNKGCLLNHSSGAASYKKLRRAKGDIEWLAIDTRHLSGKQKIIWKALRYQINTFGMRFMKRVIG